jgi:hypothetical protein
MSNYLAIAAVTAVLQNLISDSVQTIAGAEITTTRPMSPGSDSKPAINLYLYQVTHNPHWRNADLPTRSHNGRLLQRPQVALDLDYLLTFYGDEAQLVPQQLLGLTMSALHTQPIMKQQFISDVVHNNNLFSDKNEIDQHNLANQIASVKVSPLPLSLEELSKLWSVFFQTKHALSVAYQAAVVLIEADEIPSPVLPVRPEGYTVYVLPFRRPVVEAIEVKDGDDRLILSSSTLVIRGQQLGGDITKVRIGKKEASVTPTAADRIEWELSELAPLRAGVQGLQIVHEILMGSPSESRSLIESNVVPIVLRPEIIGQPTFDAATKEVTLTVEPPLGLSQRVALLLNSVDGPEAYSYTVTAGTNDLSEIKIPTPATKAGQYYVRVQVDGAESPLSETTPTQVTVP